MNMNNAIAIRLENITKEYIIHHEKPTLVEKFIKGKDERFVALDNISLAVKKGEKLGITGPNGSGKTTLLKIIAGITAPTSGLLQRNGRIVSLIDLNAGFHPDLTGEQNIFLNGILLGITKAEITKKLSSIIDFADIGRFMDAPLYTYSRGMKLRVGFSVAFHANPDILLIDEDLSVGDRNFQKKIESVIHQLFAKRKTVIVVTQWIEYLKEHCNRIIILEHGKIVKTGGIEILPNPHSS